MSPCLQMGPAIVCGSMGNPNTVIIALCETCGRRRRMLRHYAGLFYGMDDTCLTCGESWEDGMRSHRPFRPRWRAERVARAKKRAETAMRAAEFRRYVNADARRYFEYADGSS